MRLNKVYCARRFYSSTYKTAAVRGRLSDMTWVGLVGAGRPVWFSIVLCTESIQTVELSLSVSESNNKMQLLQMIKLQYNYYDLILYLFPGSKKKNSWV